jgi:hypothetical protein
MLAVAIERDLGEATIPSPTEEAGAAQRRAQVVPVRGEEAIEVGAKRFGQPGPR